MRTIAPEIFCDEFFGTLSLAERILWMGLLLICADDQGRMLDSNAMLRNLIFPFDDNQDVSREMVEAGLEKFAHTGKILRYGAGANGSGKKLIQVLNWWRYQKSASWMAASKFPAPEGWIDRYRYHSGGNQIIETNWKLPGGYLTSPLPSNLLSELPSPLPSNLLSELPRREDEVKAESEEESEEESSVKPTDDDISTIRRKTDICSYAGIPPKYSRKIIADSEISPDEILAELARNYSRKGKVKNPGIITGMNLAADPPEKAAIEWNEIQKWHQHLPRILMKKLGITFQSQDEDSENVVLVATRIHPVEAKVKRVLGRKTE